MLTVAIVSEGEYSGELVTFAEALIAGPLDPPGLAAKEEWMGVPVGVRVGVPVGVRVGDVLAPGATHSLPLASHTSPDGHWEQELPVL
jgi:hypothetical protein